MANDTGKLKLTIRQHLLGQAEIQARVADRIYAHHATDEDLSTLVYPLIVVEINSGTTAYNRVWQFTNIDVYVWSKASAGEAAEIFDLIYDALQAQCVSNDTLGTAFLAEEVDRPIEGFSSSTRSWFIRGTFTMKGVT